MNLDKPTVVQLGLKKSTDGMDVESVEFTQERVGDGFETVPQEIPRQGFPWMQALLFFVAVFSFSLLVGWFVYTFVRFRF